MSVTTIGPARVTDIRALNELLAQADRMHARRAPGVFIRPARPGRSRAFWTRMLHDRRSAMFVARAGHHVVGSVHVEIRTALRLPILRRRRFGYVGYLVVDWRWRRQGVGRALMRAVHRWLRARKIADVELNVWGFNRGAVRFYERLGYRIVNYRMGRTLR